MRPIEIIGSRWKAALYLAISLGFVAIGVMMVRDPQAGGVIAWFCLLLFACCALIFARVLVRPQRLQLDSQGFIVVGGLTGTSDLVRWRDIEPFFVYRLPRAGAMIGYNFAPGARPDSKFRKFSRWMGAEASLPKGWSKSPAAIVEQLNAYRAQALDGVDYVTPPAPSGGFGRRTGGLER